MEKDLIQFHEKLTEFVQNKIFHILGLVLICILIAGIFIGVKLYFEHKEKKAYSLLISALNSNNLKDLENLAQKYSSTKAGLEASLFLFSNFYQKKDLNSAQKYLSIYKKHTKSYFNPIVNYAEGKLLEEKKEFNKAISFYEKSLKKFKPLDHYLYLDIARLFEKQGDLQKAKKYYPSI